MTNTKHKSEILQLLSNANDAEALWNLDNMLIHGRLYIDLVHYKARYSELQSSFHDGTLSDTEYRLELNKFRRGLLNFVGNLDEREFLNQILLLSPNLQAHEHLAPSFKRYFPNTAEHYEGQVVKGDFAFVVCNDFYTSKDQQEDFDTLMESYLNAGYYLVCASNSNQKTLVNNNRSKVHAANSVFALYARVREMIDFVRYFNH